MIKTVKCKLVLTQTQALAITETMVRFAAACNEIAALVERQKMRRHTFELQKFYYLYIKEKYGLTANYAMRVCDRVADQKDSKKFNPTSVVIDNHLFRYIETKEQATLSAVGGRIRIVLALGEYQRQLLKGWKVGAGTISYDPRRNLFYANLCVKSKSPVASGSKPLGVDLGINRIATTSTGLMFSGREVNKKREKFSRTKASLQRRGTKGSKRVLKRLAGRERRFQKNLNHNISKRIVRLAKETDSFICMENLKGIRERTNRQGKRLRRLMGRWAFYQLRQFIAYKSEAAGVPLIFVDPRNTSKACSACGRIGVRSKHRFSCSSCGFVGDADVQAAVNIAVKGALANRPEVARILSDNP